MEFGTHLVTILTVMGGVDNIVPRKRHHNVMNGATLRFLCRQDVCCGFMSITERT